jgi:protein farnesyltransferase subunit beta
MHKDGEADVRATYCAVAVATGLDVATPELLAGVPEFVARCQTHEGGFAGAPGNEAHGGYTFCSLAALLLLGRTDAVRLEGVGSVRQWAARRQMRREGGFSGRANKLVDGCYSFWVGALFPLLDIAARQRQDAAQQPASPAAAASCGFDHFALQRYVLLCGQSMTGGLRDKPGKGADLYHTCYCISGLSLGQWAVGGGQETLAVNRLRAINPIFNLPVDDAERGLEWFAKQEKPDGSWS